MVAPRAGRSPSRRGCGLALELLEDRTLPSSNQTLGTALPLVFHNNQAGTQGYLSGGNEADLFRLTLGAGDVVMARVDAQAAGSPLDSVLRVFDGSGRPIALNNDYNGRDPRLTFQAATGGTYYIGVSAVGNTFYDPNTRGSGSGHSTGLYTLSVSRLETGAALLPDLVSASFQVSAATPLWGDTLTVAYTIENRGGADAGAFDSAVVLAPDNSFTAGVLSLGTLHLPGLAADSTTSGTLTVALPGSPGNPPLSYPEPGTVFLGLQVDSAQAIVQTHNGNNLGVREGLNAAAVPVLQVEGPSVPNGPAAPLGFGALVTGGLGAGQTAAYDLTLTEPGRLVVRVQATGLTTRLLLYDPHGRLVFQSPASGSAVVVLDQDLDPTGTSGSYRLKVQAVAGPGGSYALSTAFQPGSPPDQPIPVGQVPVPLAWGDFNGDGIADFAVADFGPSDTNVPGDVRIFLGNGDGTFGQGQTVLVGTYADSLVAGDFNGDGKTDLALAEYASDDVRVLLGNGDGTFQAGPVVSFGSALTGLVTGDFNGDGRLDLAVADNSQGQVHVLLGNGDGTFDAGPDIPVGTAPIGLVTADFNGDGIPDLAVAGADSGDVQVLLGQGDGTFQYGEDLTLFEYPVSLVAGDFQGDGRIDLAVADAAAQQVRILLGNGDGTFQSGQAIGVGVSPQGLLVGDFNNDGRTDLALTDFSSNDVQVLLGNGDGTFAAGRITLVGSGPNAVAAGDFDGDGRVDLVVADGGSGDVRVLLGNGDGTFRAPQVNVAVGIYPVSLVAGDFNGDGLPDLAVADAGGNDVQVLLGDGEGAFFAGATLPVSNYPTALVGGDFNGDGIPDLALAESGDAETPGDVRIFLGAGDGTFQPGQTVTAGTYTESLVSGDFNGDGIPDLAVADKGSDDVRILLGRGDGSFRTAAGSVVPLGAGAAPVFLVRGDFNGDGHTDLAVAEYGLDKVQVLLGRGDGSFRLGPTLAVGHYPRALVTGDFNGDGRKDLAVADASSGDVTVWLNAGNGTFGPALLIPLGNGAYPLSLVAVDFNGDGRTDLAVADAGSNANDIQVFAGQGNGTFQPGQKLRVGTYPISLVTADFNGDGRTDLAVADKFSNDVRALLANGDGTFAPPKGLLPGPPLPHHPSQLPAEVVPPPANPPFVPDLPTGGAPANPAPLISAVALTAPPLPPGLGQTSGTAGSADLSAGAGGMSSTDFDPAGGNANAAGIISLGSTLDLSPLSFQQGPGLPDEFAAALLTGARPARLRTQQSGPSVTPVPSLVRDAEGDADDVLPADEDETPRTQMVGLRYHGVLPRDSAPADVAAPHEPAAVPTIPGPGRQPPLEGAEEDRFSISKHASVIDALLVALVSGHVAVCCSGSRSPIRWCGSTHGNYPRLCD